MDSISRLCLVVLATYGLYGVQAIRKPFIPSDSIYDIINKSEVDRIIAARREAEEATTSAALAPYINRNELSNSGDNLMVSLLNPDRNKELPSSVDFRNILKSSKNALVVTKKEYLKKDWCKTEQLVQKIKEPGCLPTTVLNNFCYGQCNSFYIPRGPRRRDNSDKRPPAFKSCSYCRPKKVTWITVTLRCPGQSPPYKLKRLQMVKQCKCLPVEVN